ncbi:hypothetical protein AB9F35_35575, partial [Rhizobium leguminosarum]|uniref:hypothetical protein n=1 Tax=Rhizobium leguminosarum TaxID=384 RepID=UPI003F9BD515
NFLSQIAVNPQVLSPSAPPRKGSCISRGRSVTNRSGWLLPCMQKFLFWAAPMATAHEASRLFVTGNLDHHDDCKPP